MINPCKMQRFYLPRFFQYTLNTYQSGIWQGCGAIGFSFGKELAQTIQIIK